ncbi:MAG: allantoicase [Gammaproteobacteria bacterium]|nr:MAG: allantoicase [Gammaproteobacteria bacterium]UCH41685.1 MAG: allantoicase [Gammaproteobacteria bacterium]
MTEQIPEFINQWINLAQPRLGAEIVSCSDDFFAECSRMLQPEAPVFVDGKFDDHGKWMDGWETRRRRSGGYDHAVVKLGLAGEIKGIDIDTTHFTGNYPPAASLEACHSEAAPDDSTQWITLIESTSLRGDSHHYFEIDNPACFTHVRLNIYPDGGIARLRVHGRVVSDAATLDSSGFYNLAAVELGARAIAWNDAHFGVAANLLNPGRGVNMGDGWETRRRREPGNDWCIIELGQIGEIEEALIDTAHFKGNYPDRCSLQAALVEAGTIDSIITQSQFWPELLQPQKLEMDREHGFRDEIQRLGAVSHVRINIFPDGGLSRVRLLGKIHA